MPWSLSNIYNISHCFVSPVLISRRALRSYKHLLILIHLGLCLIKALPLMCARVSNHFYDLPVLTAIVYSLLPHLVKSGSSSFLSEWRHHHLVSIHLLIAAGYGDHLGPAWYLAFIMHLRFKRGLCKTVSPLYAPQKFLHDPPSAFTGDQVNPPEKRPSCK